MAHEFTKFCSDNFKLDGAKWDGKDAVVQMSQGRVARISLETTGTRDIYACLVVTIVSKTVGKIDSKEFQFSEYLSVHDCKDKIYAWSYGGNLKWGHTTPTDLDGLMSAVHSYITSMF